MPVHFRYEIEGWRPSWGQMIDIVERYNHEEENAEELRWLRAHAVDWLMVARYLRTRTENHIAETRKSLKDIVVVVDPETGRTTREYLQAKSDADKLNRRRLHWISHIDQQIHEAKYLLGFDKVDFDMRAELVDRLLMIRTAVFSTMFTNDDLIQMVDQLVRDYGDTTYDTNAYRPRNGTDHVD